MKTRHLLLSLLVFLSLHSSGQSYTPSAGNLTTRKQFQDDKFGMFTHWGASSLLGYGEWVMNQRNIKVNDYKKLQHLFNPQQFDAAKWVSTAKNAGMKYMVFITRHHDGFSNWDTKFSDWKITNTPYGKDALKQLADECKKQGLKLGLYYSTLDWFREDYPWSTGRTGQNSGRKGKGNYASYLQFMKNQLTELLTNYGDIMCIWFDGHWDQTNPEGHADRTSRIDWKYDEIYGLIHQLQPNCMIGNNHHLSPIPGEDFQMFERDLPGENKSGLSYQQASTEVPLESCETMNGSWGFNITDNNYKSVKTVLQLLIKAAGYNANLLLNVGPMPDGTIQSEFTDTLKKAGEWMAKFGETIYGTRGGLVSPKDWGTVTVKDDLVFVHILNPPSAQPYIFIPGFAKKVSNAILFANKSKVKFKQQTEGLFIYLDGLNFDPVDTIIQLEIQKAGK
jgi:alpha-L-fucosidase